MASPRKGLPDDSRMVTSSTTKRVFFCGVVVEGVENGRRLPDDMQDLILSFGGPLDSTVNSPLNPIPTPAPGKPGQRKRANTDSTSLAMRINELVTTERGYVRRLQTLKKSYADPLRQFARDKSTSLLAKYDAKVMFGNIDALLPVNEAFLADLEKMVGPNGPEIVGGIGDVALKHFKELSGFELYKQFYLHRDEAQTIFLRETSRKSSPFRDYIERVKCEACDDSGNRVGLRELLIDPVQRIPRYTMLFRMMIEFMAPHDSQRAKLVEADHLASQIAIADLGEETKRALVFRCLTSSIEGFPADLCSSSRRFIDCVDVEDIISESGSGGGGSSSSLSGTVLHCSLFLFDDKLVFVKRPNGDKSGRALAGLDDLDKLTKGGVFPPTKKKSAMTFRGVVDVTEVVAADIEGSDIHIYLENPPRDQGDRWSARPFRALSVVRPPMPAGLDPKQTEADKQRFLESLWHVQATYRSNSRLSVVRCAKEMEVDSRPGKTVLARTYFNIYQRTAFLQEPKKAKVVVHVNPNGADPIPFGIGGPPYAVIQVIPMAGDLSRFKVSSSDTTDEDEDDIVQTERVPSRIVQTIHQFGFYEFKGDSNSRPSTPTGKNKSAIFGLDVISRRLNGRPGSTMGDFFGGSINSNRRTKSTASRSSMYTQTTSTGDSMMRFSHRSNSTAATTISTMDDDTSYLARSATSRTVLRRGKSPGPTEEERASPTRSRASSRANSRTRSRSGSRERTTDRPDEERMSFERIGQSNGSEWDLNLKLELARKNSQNQHGGGPVPMTIEAPMEPTIYEEDPPVLKRPASRATSERDIPEAVAPTRPTTPVSRATSPDRRPLGPRCPSPQPPTLEDLARNAPKFEDWTQKPLPALASRSMPSGLPRSKRVPLFPTGNTEGSGLTKAATITSVATNNTGTVPLIIKKKAPSPKKEQPFAPLPRTGTTTVTSRVHEPRVAVPSDVQSSKLVQLSLSTKEDVDSAHRAVKRLKVEFESSSSSSRAFEPPSRSPSPDKMFRTAGRVPPPMTPEAEARLNEMRNLIGRREMAPQRSQTDLGTPTRSNTQLASGSGFPPGFGEQISTAERDLARALNSHNLLSGEVEQVSSELSKHAIELDKTKTELANSKRQCELVKDLLADSTAEKEIMYEAFNEELDGMYNDVNLPDDEAWERLTADLRKTKESRNAINKENSHLKRKLAESQSQQDQWETLLRSHGLIS